MGWNEKVSSKLLLHLFVIIVGLVLSNKCKFTSVFGHVKSGTRAVTVDLEMKTCDCRVWDLTSIPCAHAIAAIHDRRQNSVTYLSDYYKREKYLASYGHGLEAIKSDEYWKIYSTRVVAS